MNEITNQEYQTAKAIVEEYEEQGMFYVCNKNCLMFSEVMFSKGETYKQCNKSGELALIDNEQEFHILGQWEKRFTKKQTT